MKLFPPNMKQFKKLLKFFCDLCQTWSSLGCIIFSIQDASSSSQIENVKQFLSSTGYQHLRTLSHYQIQIKYQSIFYMEYIFYHTIHNKHMVSKLECSHLHQWWQNQETPICWRIPMARAAGIPTRMMQFITNIRHRRSMNYFWIGRWAWININCSQVIRLLYSCSC